MQACFHLGPTNPDELVTYLYDVLGFLVVANERWIRAQLDAGREPPCCIHCAKPPWTAPGGVQYVPHHGPPVGICREYWTAPKVFVEGRATCADIVGYDVAALRLLESIEAHPELVDMGGGNFHAVLWRADKGMDDPTQKWAAPVRPPPGAACGCAGGVHG